MPLFARGNKRAANQERKEEQESVSVFAPVHRRAVFSRCPAWSSPTRTRTWRMFAIPGRERPRPVEGDFTEMDWTPFSLARVD